MYHCAIISNGTAVLGFGDLGAPAVMPVLEGKSALFSELCGVNVVPIALNEKNPEKLIHLICELAPSFQSICLEDIKAPECFYIENELKNRLSIPLVHDD